MKLSERLESLADSYDGNCCGECDAHDISTIREALEIVRRVEEAPSGFVIAQVGLTEPGNAVMVTVDDPSKVKGKRVRIVEE